MKLKIVDIAIFGMLSALMFISKWLMEFLPNIHLIGVFTVAITVVYREYALFPIYGFIFLTGLFNGFGLWWIPYLYIWAVLWGLTMLLPKNMPKKVRPFVYAAICATHGFLYGTLYAPSQALLFGLDFKGMIAWIIAGLPWDAIHGFGNLLGSALICPIIYVMQQARKFSH